MTTLPEWLSSPVDTVPKSTVSKELNLVIFEQVFPTIMDKLCEGYTLSNALKEDDRNISEGAFLRWIKKDPERLKLYCEAKEIRTENWAGRIISHASGENPMEDVQRSKLIVDSYRWLMESDNRKVYGKSQQIEIGGTISVASALEAAKARLLEASTIDMPLIEKNNDMGG